MIVMEIVNKMNLGDVINFTSPVLVSELSK